MNSSFSTNGIAPGQGVRREIVFAMLYQIRLAKQRNSFVTFLQHGGASLEQNARQNIFRHSFREMFLRIINN